MHELLIPKTVPSQSVLHQHDLLKGTVHKGLKLVCPDKLLKTLLK